MTSPRPDAGCAALRLALAEPLAGTAPEAAASWLLMEHPGPWPHPGWPSDLEPAVARVLETATALAIRPQLIRPVHQRRRGRCTVVVASCRPGQRWLETRELTDVRDLADLDLEAVAAGRAPGFGDETRQPVVLVCTHGRRDVCCARRGRPVAQALDAQLPGGVWETTHVGGDRFAANVVTLPHGTYHGGVDAGSAPALAAAAVRQEVVLEHLRGTAGMPAAAQAADVFVRQALGLTAVDAVRAVVDTSAVEGVEQVQVQARQEDHATRRFVVRMVRRQVADARLTSCAGGGTRDRPYVLDLVDVTEVPRLVLG
jgi:hypothetical protein